MIRYDKAEINDICIHIFSRHKYKIVRVYTINDDSVFLELQGSTCDNDTTLGYDELITHFEASNRHVCPKCHALRTDKEFSYRHNGNRGWCLSCYQKWAGHTPTEVTYEHVFGTKIIDDTEIEQKEKPVVISKKAEKRAKRKALKQYKRELFDKQVANAKLQLKVFDKEIKSIDIQLSNHEDVINKSAIAIKDLGKQAKQVNKKRKHFLEGNA